MKSLNSDVTALLDKLYNLRGDESVIISLMDKESKSAADTEEKTKVKKAELEEKINDITNKETILHEEGERFKSAIEGIKKKEYETIIESLKIDFDPDKVLKQIETELPLTLERLAQEKQSATDELSKIEDEMSAAESKIEEIDIRKSEVKSNQDKLNRYIDMALNSNINITRDEITSLLAQLNFTEDEQREIAKLLMFPEDGLFEYDKAVRDEPTQTKSITEVIQEAKESVSQEEEKKEEPIIDAPLIDDSRVDEIISLVQAATEKPLIEDIKEEEIVFGDEKEENASPREVLIKLLGKLGFDYLDFTNNDFAKIIDNYNEELIEKNVKLVTDMNINKDIFNDNVELFYDKELEKKIQKLTEVGKMPQDIYLNPNVLTKYNYEELNSAIKLLNENGLDPKSVPLMAY